MSIAKKIRKGKMARKQKERQEKANDMLVRVLQEVVEDPVNRNIITLVIKVWSDDDFMTTLTYRKNVHI